MVSGKLCVGNRIFFDEIATARDPDFRHTIDVPSRRVNVMLFPRVEVLALSIYRHRAAVWIWMNDPV